MHLLLLSIVLLPGVFTAPATAHPHMFIDVSATFVLTDSTLSGISVTWELDEMNSASLIQEFDLNNNKQFEKKEYEKLENEAFSGASESNFFTVITWADHFLHEVEAHQFVASIQSNTTIRYSFFIPCNLPIKDIAGKRCAMFFDDPSMFVAFTLKKKQIHVSKNKHWTGSVVFKKEDYYELIKLNVKRNTQ